MMHTRVEFITPEMAKKYLDLNISNNRKISKPKVETYAREMLANRWMVNGETIKFSNSSGRIQLIDGQKRLHAAIKARELDPTFSGFSSVICDNLDPEAMYTIDVGQARTSSNRLDLLLGKQAYQTERGSLIKCIHLYKNENLHMLNASSITPSEEEQIYFSYKDLIEEGVNFISLPEARNFGYGQPVGFFFMWAKSGFGQVGVEYINGIVTGLGVNNKKDQRYIFRTSYGNKRRGDKKNKRLSRSGLIEALYRNFDKWINGVPEGVRVHFKKSDIVKFPKEFYKIKLSNF